RVACSSPSLIQLEFVQRSLYRSPSNKSGGGWRYRAGPPAARRSRRWGILCAPETDPRESMQECETPFGALTRDRYPPTANPTLHAWDAPDLPVLQQCQPPAGGRRLVIR